MFSRVSKVVPLILVVALLAINALPALAQDEQDIVDVAVANGNFTTLVAAVEAAGLVDTLKSEGPFTVFAPTDEAFAALPEGTVEALLADIPALTDILLYHVVAGKVMAADVVNLDSADTVQGQPVAITVDADGNVFVNDAQVIITDVEASNGVIHVIDAVIIPPAEEPAALPATGADNTSSTLLIVLAIGAGLLALGTLLRPARLAGDTK